MHLFHELRSRYGQHAVKSIRDLESNDRKLVRYQQHLTFTHRCKDKEITPSSLKLRCPINTEKAKNIIRRAEKELINERIRVIHNKVRNLKKKQECQQNVLETLKIPDPEVRQHVDKHVENNRKHEEETTKERHKKKINWLLEKKELADKNKVSTELDLSGTQLKKWREKWVKNISDQDLTDPQQKLLSRGLGFAVAVDHIPHDDFIVACETACTKLSIEEAQNLRMEVAGTLKSANLPKPNISKDEKVALRELQKSKDLLIMGADKGKCTVVQSTLDYEKKVKTMLSDERTYEKLKKDPTQVYKRKLLGLLQKLKNAKKIEENQYRLLYPTAETIPRLYCTTKIHKEGNPIRPIVDYMGSIGYQTSKALAEILSPIVGTSEHHVVNSKHLAEELSGVLVEEDEIFNSHDVVSLFTNTPIQETMEIIRERLEEDTSLKNRTLLTVNDIMDLLEFILTTTYFTFRGVIYRQRFGAAMGSPVSAIIANLFMEWLEKKAIATAPLECKPRLWRRYVDDVLEIIKKDTTEQLTEHLNGVDTTGNIKFTYEEEQNGKIPFLDTLIVRKEDGSVKLLVYRKKTHTDQYLNFDSQHPLHQKIGVVRTLLDRMHTIVTEDKDKEEEESRIKKAVYSCGYPKWAFDKAKNRWKRKQIWIRPKESVRTASRTQKLKAWWSSRM
ncbi:uncharacterized protein [Amphiura filiformis]|uniref:uncharacterized protein n=1 Tax=Amphiura filiformis TaxID=82378 RepID=UPI003B22403D